MKPQEKEAIVNYLKNNKLTFSQALNKFKLTISELNSLKETHEIEFSPRKDPNKQSDGRKIADQDWFISEITKRWKYWAKHQPNKINMYRHWLVDNYGATKKSFLHWFLELPFTYRINGFHEYMPVRKLEELETGELIEVERDEDPIILFVEEDWKLARDLCVLTSSVIY